VTTLLTPGAYMALLVKRARAADAEMHSDRAAAGLRPLPSWRRHLPEQMILDGSIERVVRLQNRRVAVVAKLHRAEAREAS